ncbi:hypothetical protein H0A64_03245 [Alcaligenaceae bacterium]|nr:hypothetical protein [Alcaligenaceae bacterium]
MSRHRNKSFSAGARRSFAMVLMLLFLLRAFIPMGYMPAHAAGSGALLTMTLCVKGLPSGVIKTLALDGSNQQAEPPALQCAFGAATDQSILLLAAMGLVIALFYVAGRLLLRRAPPGLRYVLLGPPIGSRAPPPNPSPSQFIF